MYKTTYDRFSFLFFPINEIKVSNKKNVSRVKQKNNFFAFTSSFILGLALFFSLGILPTSGFAQGVPNPNEAEWNGGGYSIKKVVSNVSIASGVNFSYTILFTAPAGATTVTIKDIIPASLEVVLPFPTAAPVNGVTPSLTVTGGVGSQVVDYTLSSLPPGSASSGSFTIVVKFPEGTTCNGATARNRIGILTDDWHYTPYVSTSATAADPWKVVKSIVSGPVVNPGGGACGYLMEAGDTVTYRLSVLKNSPYYGNVVGQQNMSSALVTDVLPAGAIMLSSTCGIPANSTGTITWQPNLGNLDAANPWAYYYCDITVYYPAVSFPNGSFVYNEVDLDGVMCNQPVSHSSNQTCIEIGQVIANPNGYFNKSINLTNRVPGCQGYYRVTFCNNGNVPLSAFNIDDVIPSGITVDQIKIYSGNATTTMALTANSGVDVIASSITTSYFDSGTLGIGVSNLQWQMTGSLPVGACIHMYIYFNIDPNPTGTVITNCADFDGLSNSLSLPQTCVSFTVDAGEPHPCVLKQVCSPLTSYEPGDIVRFRLRVQNIGSADITGAIFQDVLNSNFTYVGNESYYTANTYNPACSSGGGIPAGTTAWPGVTPTHSGSNLSWSLPDIPSDCQSFYVGYCGYYGTWGLPYYFVDFDVMVDSSAMPGVTPNNYDISGGNLSSTVNSNSVNVLVVASFGQEVEKLVSTDNGSTFAASGIVAPGDTARYRLTYKNTSNVSVTSVNLVDLLPKNDNTNDWLVLNRVVARGSSFDVAYGDNHSTSLLPSGPPAPTPVLTSAAGYNICLPTFGINAGCNPTTWGSPGAQNINMDYSTFVLNSNVSILEDFDVTVPLTATLQQQACNDFAAISTADFLLDGVPQTIALTPIAAPPVCITIDTSEASCCDSIRLEQVVNADGSTDCCVRLSTKCEVKSISVAASNGTISSVAWNCGTIPAGYVGQANYVFGANGCVVDMTTCFEPNQQGIISVTFIIDFQNGDKCEKTIELDCGPSQGSCCDSLIVEEFQDPDLGGVCCAKLITKCEVDSVFVNIINGTISSSSWNCGTIPAGYVGQSSYTFDANLCAVDMTVCATPDQTGMVAISYMVYFQNGEKCEKIIELDCGTSHINCCDSIEVRQVVNSAGALDCCTELTTKCEVDSVMVTVTNGTFSSNTWNCGTTIPAAAIGQSSYMFVASNCLVDMINCIEPDQTGGVVVNYLVYFADGEKCEKGIQMDCKLTEKSCCDSVKVERVVSADGTAECCAKIVTDCEVDSIAISVGNGTISSTIWNCGNLPNDYMGQSSYTFNANLCAVDMTTCVDPSQTGVVTISYIVYFQNGEICEKTVELDCGVTTSDCCALVDFKLKQKWPHFGTQIGVFNITNIDPSSPICSVTINGVPSGTLTPGVLVVDGVSSTQSWNSTSIPASGSLAPTAVNTIQFSLIGANYHGIITVCVEKCNGTKCCFEFKWNKKPLIDIGIELEQFPVSGKLHAVTINPIVTTDMVEKVKSVSIGMFNEQEVIESGTEFFAISATEHVGDEYPTGLEAPMAAYMGKYNAFFELSKPKSAGEDLGAFNLVFTKILPKLGCTLFDEEGNIIFSGEIDVNQSDTIPTALIQSADIKSRMFEFVKLYPNPSNGSFNITYATGSQREVEIRIINPLGQVVDVIQGDGDSPGIHDVYINADAFSGGLYKVVLYSEGQVLSKSAVIKE